MGKSRRPIWMDNEDRLSESLSFRDRKESVRLCQKIRSTGRSHRLINQTEYTDISPVPGLMFYPYVLFIVLLGRRHCPPGTTPSGFVDQICRAYRKRHGRIKLRNGCGHRPPGTTPSGFVDQICRACRKRHGRIKLRNGCGHRPLSHSFHLPLSFI